MNEIISEAFINSIELLELVLRDHPSGLFGGTHKSKSYGSSPEFADYKEYMPGDDIRRIDWSIFARFDKLYEKMFLDERQMHTRIYIDASSSMGFDGKGTRAIQLAAFFAYLSVKAMDKVSIYIIRENHCEELIVGLVGKDNYISQIRKLNTIEFEGDSFISDAILPSKVGYGDGMSIVLSDFLTDNDYVRAVEYLREKRRDVLFVQVLSETDLNPQYKNKYLFYDSENKNVTFRKYINKDVLRAYRQALQYIQDTLFKSLASRGGNYILVNSDHTLEQTVFQTFANREVVR